jgi:hypothetical protein
MEAQREVRKYLRIAKYELPKLKGKITIVGRRIQFILIQERLQPQHALWSKWDIYWNWN